MLRGGLEDILSLSPSWEEANSFLKIYDYIRTNINFMIVQLSKLVKSVLRSEKQLSLLLHSKFCLVER